MLVDSKGVSAAQRHFGGPSVSDAKVRWKDLATRTWQPPAPMLARVRGAVCVYPPGAEKPIWLPEKCIRPAEEIDKNASVDTVANDDAHDDASGRS